MSQSTSKESHEYIKLSDLKKWRAEYISSGRACSYDDMTALAVFINNVQKYKEGTWTSVKY